MKRFVVSFLQLDKNVESHTYRKRVTSQFILLLSFIIIITLMIGNFISNNLDLFYINIGLFISIILILSLPGQQRQYASYVTLHVMALGILLVVYFHQIPVVIISAHDNPETISKAMAYGAAGFVPKSTPVDEIYSAINAVLSGDTWLPAAFSLQPSSEETVNIADRVASLTQQQYRILKMFAEGMLNKQIAYNLHVSEATIKAHATAIFKKLNVRNRTQAVIAIAQLDLSESDLDYK